MTKSTVMSDGGGWVHETRFGLWLQGSFWWHQYVLADALRGLSDLLGPYDRFNRILDVGCGTGHALPLLEAYFYPKELIGIDIDPALVAISEKAVAPCACNVEIRVGDATKLDLPDNSMDMILCHQTMHHLAKQEDAAREFYRVLAPGGVLLFSESCRSFIYSLWVRLLFRHPMEVQKTSDEYQDMLRAAGFVFTSRNVSTPYPGWTQPDFGIRELLGRPPSQGKRSPLLNLAAFKPQ